LIDGTFYIHVHLVIFGYDKNDARNGAKTSKKAYALDVVNDVYICIYYTT
jgi:hypothetical protein